MEMEPLKEFNWSISKFNSFNQCKRKYFFENYGYWGGWNSTASERNKKIYLLKQLRNKYLYVGDIVHKNIQFVFNGIQNRTIIPFKDMMEDIARKVKTDLDDSKNKRYKENPKQFCGLLEDESGSGLTDVECEKIFDDCYDNLNNFYQSEYFHTALSLAPNQWLPFEEFCSFVLDGTKIGLKIDFLYMASDTKLTIIDWKTGKIREDKNDLQLPCYAIYASNMWGIKTENITLIYYYLKNNSKKEIVTRDEDIITAKRTMSSSITDMKNMLFDRDNNIAREEDFLPSVSTLCRFCNYSSLCNSEK